MSVEECQSLNMNITHRRVSIIKYEHNTIFICHNLALAHIIANINSIKYKMCIIYLQFKRTVYNMIMINYLNKKIYTKGVQCLI